MRKNLFRLVRIVNRLFFSDIEADEAQFSPFQIFRSGVVQKIFMINRKVPWPVHPTTRILAPHKIIRGTRCPGLSAGCHLDGRNGILFGKNVWVGPYVSIISQNHDVNGFSVWVRDKPIVIGDNCWIGAHAIILPGVSLSEHTVVAAGAVVTKSFADKNVIVAGNPAGIVKQISKYKGTN